MSADKAAYRQILKVTSIFGGMQFFNIIIGLIRTKLIAVFIGPLGIGISSLLSSTIDLIVRLSGLGIETSAVREITKAENDPFKLASVVTILNKFSFITGLTGFLITLIFSEQLSKIVYGTTDYGILFIWVSVSVLLKQITNAKNALFQGLRKVNDLARINVYGGFLGLVLTIPLYYYFKIDAIVPSIVIVSIIGFLIPFFYARNISLPSVQLSFKEIFSEGKEMIHLGLILSAGGLITLLASYLVQIYINYNGGIDHVGYYNAGFTILNSYVGLIFTVMSTDYFPKLIGVIDKKELIEKIVFEQIYMAVMLITPIIVFFLVFSGIVVKLLYSKEFIPVNEMITWGVLGMLFKTVSWGIGFILIAAGNSKLFLKNSIGFNLIFLVLNIFGYHFYGFEGIGISYMIYYVIHLIVIQIIVKRHYDFALSNEFYKMFFICIFICLVTFTITYISFPLVKWSLLVVMMVVSVFFSYRQLDKKINFKEILISKGKKDRT